MTARLLGWTAILVLAWRSPQTTLVTANTTARSSAQGGHHQAVRGAQHRLDAATAKKPGQPAWVKHNNAYEKLQRNEEALTLWDEKLAALAASAAKRPAKQGPRLNFGAALSTGPGPLQNSCRAALGSKAAGGSSPVLISGVHSRRATATHTGLAVKGGITVMSIYTRDGMGLQAEGLERTQRLGRLLVQRSEPLVVAGNWSNEDARARAGPSIELPWRT